MPAANLLWNHPDGDTIKVPCSHLEVKESDHTEITVPTKIEVKQEHENDEIDVPVVGKKKVPCLHLSLQVTPGTKQIPIYTVQPKDPAGDPTGLMSPCIHPLTPSVIDAERRIVFFTNDAMFQQIATEQVDLLVTKLHVRNVGAAHRPLLFFFREPVNGNPNDPNDPFWSHYDPILHAIQITRDPAGIDYQAVRSVISHELGHAIVGQKCVQVATQGGPHSMKKPSTPGTAMSEGWADFVRSALDRPRTSNKFLRDPAVPRTADIEYNVMLILWDLYDVRGSKPGPHGTVIIPDDDPAAFTFEQLYGIFSPSLDTLPAGPVIWDIGDYLGRLKKEYPDRAADIDAVRSKHLG